MVNIALDRPVSHDAMREALASRLAAWTALGHYRSPICRYPPDVRKTINAASDRIAASNVTLVAGLWQRQGRWADPANKVELILSADGEGFLMFAPGRVRPELWQIRAAEAANARRFGPASSIGRRPGRLFGSSRVSVPNSEF